MQDVKSNYTILHTYAKKTNSSACNPINVSIYEFVSNEIKLVVGSFEIDDHRNRAANVSERCNRVHVGAQSE